MTGISNIITLGVLIGVVILALKTGLGCGLANLKRREIVYTAFIYFIVSVILGYLVGVIALDITQNILATGVTMHLIIATGLVYFGIKTKREWLSRGTDLSRKTSLWLSIPCPVCLTATFLACLMLSQLTEINNLWIGAIVGVIFFIGVCFFSFSVSSIAGVFKIKTPSTLGTAMLLFGLFYLLSPLIIPAYIQAQNIPVPGFSVDYREIFISFLMMTLLIGLGFLMDKHKRLKKKKRGKEWTHLQE
ncbi:MAG: transporter [Methanophagales archaeon ANME-1-THS]|nr:MAG: transporter [Methanophagales archaeon ANME-1-THS]